MNSNPLHFLWSCEVILGFLPNSLRAQIVPPWQNPRCKGIRIEAENHPLSFSAWPYTQQQLEGANRIEELTFGKTITLNVDYRQMGVGGDNTWSLDARQHEAFRIPAKTAFYRFSIKPIN